MKLELHNTLGKKDHFSSQDVNGKRVISSKFIFKVKRYERQRHGNFKARLIILRYECFFVEILIIVTEFLQRD